MFAEANFSEIIIQWFGAFVNAFLKNNKNTLPESNVFLLFRNSNILTDFYKIDDSSTEFIVTFLI